MKVALVALTFATTASWTLRDRSNRRFVSDNTESGVAVNTGGACGGVRCDEGAMDAVVRGLEFIVVGVVVDRTMRVTGVVAGRMVGDDEKNNDDA